MTTPRFCRICVLLEGRKIIKVEAPYDCCTWAQFKRAIETSTGLPAKEQHIYFGGEKVQGKLTTFLEDLNIGDGSVVAVLRKTPKAELTEEEIWDRTRLVKQTQAHNANAEKPCRRGSVREATMTSGTTCSIDGDGDGDGDGVSTNSKSRKSSLTNEKKPLLHHVLLKGHYSHVANETISSARTVKIMPSNASSVITVSNTVNHPVFNSKGEMSSDGGDGTKSSRSKTSGKDGESEMSGGVEFVVRIAPGVEQQIAARRNSDLTRALVKETVTLQRQQYAVAHGVVERHYLIRLRYMLLVELLLLLPILLYWQQWLPFLINVSVAIITLAKSFCFHQPVMFKLDAFLLYARSMITLHSLWFVLTKPDVLDIVIAAIIMLWQLIAAIIAFRLARHELKSLDRVQPEENLHNVVP